jgi:hypothetical protein
MGCLMKNGIATHDSLSHEYFVLQINGRTDSIHRRYENAVREGLLLKNQFPHVAIKVCARVRACAKAPAAWRCSPQSAAANRVLLGSVGPVPSFTFRVYAAARPAV